VQLQTTLGRRIKAATHRGLLITLGAASLAIAACRRHDGEVKPGWSPKPGEAVLGVPATEVITAIQAALDSPSDTIIADNRAHVKRLYAAYGNVPLWLEPDGFHKSRSDALLRAVLDANTDAIRLDNYPLDQLVTAIRAVRETKKPTAEQLATADLLLTSTYVELAEDLLSGQLNPKSLSQDWFISTNHEPMDSALARSLRDTRLDSAILRMRPQEPDYDALRTALVRYRNIVADGGWPTIPKGKALKPGESDASARIAALRERLRAGGFGDTTRVKVATADDNKARARGPSDKQAATASRAVYDSELAGLVAEFQARHGIVVDSVLGAETVNSLNLPAQYRLAQIAANLERYRWMPRSFGGRYIVVNVPAFRLRAHDSSGTLEMKVIVGAEFEGRKTPVFADSMESVVFRPYWFITPEIQAKETEPAIAANPDYMAANNLEYYEEGGNTRIRQKPGEKNSLGLVKFLFPNTFNIYLHDTPNDELFEKDVRGFSHGCIRLEKPAELAQWVLGWDAARVSAAMEQGKDDQSVKLPHKIPVYIMYATAFERDGQLHFGNDLYNRDDVMVQAISSSIAPTPEAVQRLQALRKLVD
jgi:murein L,D-transpeptidase YcbB/YkuD